MYNLKNKINQDSESINFTNVFNDSDHNFYYLFTVTVNCDLTLKFIKITNENDFKSIKDAELYVILQSAGGSTIVNANEFINCLYEIEEVNISGVADYKYSPYFKNDSFYMGELFMLYGVTKKDVSLNGVNEFDLNLKVDSMKASIPIKMMFDKTWVHISSNDLDRVLNTMGHLDLIIEYSLEKYNPSYPNLDKTEQNNILSIFYIEEELPRAYPIEIFRTVLKYPHFEDECGYDGFRERIEHASFYHMDDVYELMDRVDRHKQDLCNLTTCAYHVCQQSKQKVFPNAPSIH